MKDLKLNFFHTKTFYWLLIVGFYLICKLFVNPEPLLRLSSSHINIGLFNYSPQSAHSAEKALIEMDPVQMISPYETHLSSSHPLSWFSRDSELHQLHIMGTDNLGRDIFAGYVAGFEVSILLGLGTAFLAGFFSMLFGSLNSFNQRFPRRSSILSLILSAFILALIVLMAGWWVAGIIPGIVFILLSGLLLLGMYFLLRISPLKSGYILPTHQSARFLNSLVQPLPDLVILAVLSVSLTGTGLGVMIIILSLLRIPSGAWYMQGVANQVATAPFVSQARQMGIPTWRILLKHIIPAMKSQGSTFMALTASRAILAESALSFLGIGPTGNYITWGSMIKMGLSDTTYFSSAAFCLLSLVLLQLLLRKML